MTFKRLILALLVVAMGIAPVAHAENAPTCADEHLTGEDCQSADMDPSADQCHIKVWVGKASCDLVVPSGVATAASIWAQAWADQGTTPEFDVVVRDKATGTVLYNTHWRGDPAAMDPSEVTYWCATNLLADPMRDTALLGGPVWQCKARGVEGQFVRNTNMYDQNWLAPGGGSEVICEVTGTHTKLGAATAAAGETSDVDVFGQISPGVPLLYNNDFLCRVNPGGVWSPPPISPGAHGCVATRPERPYPANVYFGTSCLFYGEPSGVPSGVISATTGTYTVSHEAPSGTVVDISGSGPGARPFTFTQGVIYTLTVNSDGMGAVTAGSPE